MASVVVDPGSGPKKEPASSSSSTSSTSSSSSTTSSPHSHPHLSLTIDTPPSASPFPSPSSSFLPPPIPGAHEFAMGPVPVGRRGLGGANGSGSGYGHGRSSSGGGSAKNVGSEGGGKGHARTASAGGERTGMGGVNANGVGGGKENEKERDSDGRDGPVTPRAVPSNANSVGTSSSSSIAAPASSTAALSKSGPTTSTTSTTATTSTSARSAAAALAPLAPAPAIATISPTPTTPTLPSAKRVSFPPPASRGSSNSGSANPTPSSTPITSAFLIAAQSLSDDPSTPTPSSSRPAPPSPALSRRTSMARSESRRNSGQAFVSASPESSRRASAQMGRSPSSSRGSPRSSRVLSGGTAAPSASARHRLSQSISAAEVEREAGFVDAVEAPSPDTPAASTSSGRPAITIRDYAYPPADARYAGLGPDVPRECDPARLARRLKGISHLSDYATPASPEQDDDDDDEDGWGAGGFVWGRGRMAFDVGNTSPAAARDGVGADDFARNFGDPGDEEGGDGEGGYLYDEAGGEGGGEGEEDEMYYAETYADVPPGLYRAQFEFEALDGAEMPLEEGQLIHVLGSGGDAGGENGDGAGDGDGGGGGAGWAVARDRDPPLVLPDVGVLEVNAMVGARTDAGRVWGEMWAAAAANATNPPAERRALVPDSYIVLIRGEGEREADAHARLVRYLEWVERERQRQAEEAAELAKAGAGAGAGAESPDSSEEGEYEDALAGDERGRLVQT